MADEQDRWLDRRTAELLLRGTSPDAVDPAARQRAERLAATLAALTPVPPPTSEELPGEAAALAAFRKARAERADARDGMPAALADGSGARPRDAGLVRIGGPGDAPAPPRRWRPLRLALAASLTVGLIGGAAAAAGTGVLPTPFGGDEPTPGASVSAAVSPDGTDQPLVEPPVPSVPGSAGATTAGPGAADRTGPADPGAGGTARDTADDGTAALPGDTTGDATGDGEGRSAGGRNGIVTACRDLRAGKDLDRVRRRALTDAAGSGGAARVWTYCKALLAGADAERRGGEDGGTATRPGDVLSGGDGRGGTDEDDDKDQDDGTGRADGTGRTDGGGRQDKGGRDKKGRGGKKAGSGDAAGDGPGTRPRARGAQDRPGRASRPARAVHAGTGLRPADTGSDLRRSGFAEKFFPGV
ncbi:hypothetical protein DN402_13640 [Streptomyces sp. SW4]|nr:hypothetical protein DN402_13640 [Streptomyces sp. SW4]